MSKKSVTFAAAKVGDKVCHFGSYDAHGTTFDNDEMSDARKLQYLLRLNKKTNLKTKYYE